MALELPSLASDAWAAAKLHVPLQSLLIDAIDQLQERFSVLDIVFIREGMLPLASNQAALLNSGVSVFRMVILNWLASSASSCLSAALRISAINCAACQWVG